MKATEKHVVFLFALLIPALLVGCKSKPIEVEVLPSVAETHDASNPFVGVWERSHRHDHNVRHIYTFTDKNKWESYTVYQDIISPYPYKGGTYTYKGSLLFMTQMVYWGDYWDVVASPETVIARLDGGELKIKSGTYENTLRRVSADCDL